MIAKIKENFLSYYILFPRAANEPEEKKRNVIKSVALGVFTLGLLHLGCFIVYAVKMKMINAAYRKEIHEKTNAVYSSTVEASISLENSSSRETKSVDVTRLTVEEIKAMTPDQQGDLIDRFSLVGKTPMLTNEQRNAMVTRPYDPSTDPKMLNRQEVGKGHCGRYAINNALQGERLSESAFLEAVVKSARDKLAMNEEDARAFVQDDDNFGVDADLLKLILEEQLNLDTEIKKVADLAGQGSKQEALEAFLEGKDWALVCNASDNIFVLPCETKYPLRFTRGHIAAIHRDNQNNWWFIDSRAEKPVCMQLALIPLECTLVA